MTKKPKMEEIVLDENSDADIEEQDDDSELMREFGDFIVPTSTSSSSSSSSNNSNNMSQHYNSGSDEDEDDDEDEDEIDPMRTMLEISIFDAIVHGKRYQNGTYIDDSSQNMVYTKYLKQLTTVYPDEEFQESQNIIKKLQSLLVEISNLNSDFADFVQWLPNVLNWRIDENIDNAKYKLIHLYYEIPKTLDMHPFERIIEVSTNFATPEIYMHVWIAVNWHIWVRLVVYRYTEIWNSCSNSFEVFQKMTIDSSKVFIMLRTTYENSKSYLESLLASCKK